MPKKSQALPPGPAARLPPLLDEIDRAIVSALVEDGRLANTALARSVGIAESTCLGRVRSLRDRGVITGIHASVDPATLGLPVQAMIAVRFGGHVREQVEEFQSEVRELPGVLSVIHVSGANDFLVHVAAASSDALRDIILDELTNRPGVANVETSLIFEATRGTALS